MRKKKLVRVVFSTILICSLWSIPTLASEIDLDNIFVTSTASTEPFKAPADIVQTSESYTEGVESTLEAVEETKVLSSVDLPQTQELTTLAAETTQASTQAAVFPTLEIPITQAAVENVTVSETTVAQVNAITEQVLAETSVAPTESVAALAPETAVPTASVTEAKDAELFATKTLETVPETEVSTIEQTISPETAQALIQPNSNASFMSIQELLNADGYCVLKITTGKEVASLSCATWTAAGGQDDVRWTSIVTGGNTESKLYIYDADFMNRAGTYINHIYAYDANGNLLDLQEFDVNIENTSPFLCVDVIENTNNTYTVYVDTVEDIVSVACAAWTEAGGQDDIVWKYQDKQNKYRTTFTIPISEHNKESGKYINHIYATYKNGTIVGPVGISANVVYTEPLAIRDVWSDANSYIGTVKTLSDIKTIGVATWTEAGGQDDIIWEFYDTVNNEAVFTVNRSDHNNESGKYITHIYSYNQSGQTVGLIGYTMSYDK